MSIIGLVGFAGCGKGTVADILVKKYGYTKIAFADSVKDACSVIFGWERSLLEGDTEQSREFREKTDAFWSARLGYDLTPRLALQKMGTEAGRDVFGMNLWITSVENKILQYDNVVLADTRFPNEIAFIHKLYGTVIRVKRGPEPEWWSAALAENSGNIPDGMKKHHSKIHYSEWAWIGTKFDHTLENDGDLNDLEREVDFILTSSEKDSIMKSYYHGEKV
jgi:hypothetical protein